MRKSRDSTLEALNAALNKRGLIIPYKPFGIKRSNGSKIEKTKAGRIAIICKQQEREENES